MSGFVLCYGSCIRCGIRFGFNPHKVPSTRLTPESPREPLCESCMLALNAKRKALKLEPLRVEPDAYAAIPEGEL